MDFGEEKNPQKSHAFFLPLLDRTMFGTSIQKLSFSADFRAVEEGCVSARVSFSEEP